MTTEELAEAVAEGVAPLVDRLKAMETRLAAVEQKVSAEAGKRLEYAGTWQRGASYRPGHIVTDGGSAWHCVKANVAARPPGDAWVLMVKKGSDGKDSR